MRVFEILKFKLYFEGTTDLMGMEPHLETMPCCSPELLSPNVFRPTYPFCCAISAPVNIQTLRKQKDI